jgi:hypothetical protein
MSYKQIKNLHDSSLGKEFSLRANHVYISSGGPPSLIANGTVDSFWAHKAVEASS